MKISLLINMKMPTTVGIFIFISRENFMLSWVELEKNFYNLEAWSDCMDEKTDLGLRFTQMIWATTAENVPSDMCSSEDSDQPAFYCSLFRSFDRRIWVDSTCIKNFLLLRTMKTDQISQMRRLIWVFVGRTYQKERFGSFLGPSPAFCANKFD